MPLPTLTHSVAAAITNVNPNLDVTFRLIPDVVAGSITGADPRDPLGVFGALSLLLAVVGICGLTSYAVSRRRKEIGIRMALA